MDFPPFCKPKNGKYAHSAEMPAKKAGICLSKISQRTAGIKRFSAAPAQSSIGCQFGSSFASKHIQSRSFVTFSSARFSGSSSRLNQRLSVVSRFSRKLPPVLKDGGAGIDLRRLIAGLTAEEVSCLFHGDIRLAGDHFRRDLPQAGVAFEVVGVLSVGNCASA